MYFFMILIFENGVYVLLLDGIIFSQLIFKYSVRIFFNLGILPSVTFIYFSIFVTNNFPITSIHLNQTDCQPSIVFAIKIVCAELCCVAIDLYQSYDFIHCLRSILPFSSTHYIMCSVCCRFVCLLLNNC